MVEMKVMAVEQYGDVKNLIAKKVTKPEKPQGHNLLVKGVYDDYGDYCGCVPRPSQIIGFDGAGTVEEFGLDLGSSFKTGDDVFYSGSSMRYSISLSMQDALPKAQEIKSTMPLTYLTVYEALVERMEMKKGEEAALLIINGSG
ncbi:MAG: hypothetical protein Q9187_003514, partial [Circinaria calcarea]